MEWNLWLCTAIAPMAEPGASGGTAALNVRQAAKFLGVHTETVRRLARRGELPAFKVGRNWRFRREALLRWAETHRLRERKPHVLVVDDERSIRDLVCRALEPEGCVVHTAADGEEGLRQVAERPPDLVFLDLHMPGMDGPGFLRRFREDHPNTPVVVVTGYPDGDLMLEASRLGTILLLAKPIRVDQLIQAVRVTL